MDNVPINWGLIGNPWNWLIIVLMVWIAGLALALIFHQSTATAT
jgi:hypothetical protein